MTRYLALGYLIVGVAIVGILLYIAHKLFGKGIMQGAQWLKEETPLGAPARVIDSVVTKATGREETLGGWLAEILDPSTRKVNEIFSSPIHRAPQSPYSINPRDRT